MTKKLRKLMGLPCKKCPYTLGEVKMVVNPCPQCKLNGYNMYEMLTSNKKKPQ